MMETSTEKRILEKALSPEEWGALPAAIVKKLDDFANCRFDEFITARALAETGKFTLEQAFTDLQTKFETLKSQYKETQAKYDASSQTIEELELQLSTTVSDVTKVQASSIKLELECSEMRKQRNVAVDEKEDLLRMVERRTGELERMQADVNTLKKQLEVAIVAKCEALAQSDEVASKKLSLEYQEKRIEQDRQLLNQQVQSLKQDLGQKTNELLNLRRDNSTRCLHLEAKLNEKTQELGFANDTIKTLTEANNNLMQRAEELVQKLQEEKEVMIKTQESYEHEINAQIKLADLYKTMSEEKVNYAEELAKGLQDVKGRLNDAIEKYGDLETKFQEAEMAHEEILEKKNECISVLKKELEGANEMLSSCKNLEFTQKKLEELCPTASAISQSARPGTMTMTQMITEINRLGDELADRNEEIAKLNAYIHQVQQQIQEKGPLLIKQREDYENAIENIEELTRANDALTNEIQQLREDMAECRRSESTIARENERLNKDVLDLSRQVCHLLKEVEASRIGVPSSNSTDMSDSQSSADIITKNLVTFSDIPSLQATNQKLLAIVRELSAKQEEAELFDPAAIAELNNKLESMRAAHNELLEQQERSSQMMKILVDQRDLYKNMYLQAKKGQVCLDLSGQQQDSLSKDQDEEEGEQSGGEKTQLQEIEAELEKAKKEIDILNKEYETYKTEKAAHENILVEQLDKRSAQVQTLTMANAKLTAKCETNDELFKTLKNNVDIYKNQVEKLQERNNLYNTTIVKHETTLEILRNELMQCQTKLSGSEVALHSYEKEVALLRDSESRLARENNHLRDQQQAHTVLQTNIDLLKATIERKDAESRIRLEEQLKDAHRELSALRRRLQEEQDRYRQLGHHLEQQTKTAQSRMEEEKQQADKLRKELAELREEYSAKIVQIEQLSKKLKTSILTNVEQNPDSKKMKDLQKMYEEAVAQIDGLQEKLKMAKQTSEQHSNIAKSSEKQLQEVLQIQDDYKKQTEDKLKEQEKLIAELKEKCDELEGELSVQTDGQEAATMGMRSKIKNLEDTNQLSVTELSELQKSLEDARKDVQQLTENLQVAEEKYAREMMLHTADLQALSAVKEEIGKLTVEINAVKLEREQAMVGLEESRAGWNTTENLYKKELADLEERFKNMDTQNSLLLDQLQSLNTQLTVVQSQSITDTANVSLDNSLNQSVNEETNSGQLLKIIKYLRQEKDIALSKCEILEAEHSRLKMQQELINKQLEDAKGCLENERQKSEGSMVTAAKHAEVLRKVETLNAITDSNRALRIERDNLVSQVNELKARMIALEEQLAPLQEANRELSNKAEAMQTENITLRGEATRWRQRANILIEKSNRTSPEDWKKLQNERENLAKQLTIERANMVKLTEELNTTKQDKARLEDVVKALRQQQLVQKTELDHMSEDLGSLRAQIFNLNQELIQVKEVYEKAVEEIKQLKTDGENKSAGMNDLKNNLAQIRKIAKKYKQQFEDTNKELETLKQQMESQGEGVNEEKAEELRAEGRAQLEERISQLEATHNEALNNLNEQIANLTQSSETYKKQMEDLKQTTAEKEDKFKILFKNAKDRIVSLQEQLKDKEQNSGKAGPSSEANQEKTQQEKDFSDIQANLERLEKEKEEILNEKQLVKEKFALEIEALNQKVNQLQKQLGLQSAGSKPSTSSGVMEKSCSEPPTANIKPMAGHSTNTQTQAVTIQPWRSGGETPLASIRPMSMQVRTVAVPPTSQSPSAVMVPPQQQVHTTGGTSNLESMSSSPTSSHTDYIPATSSGPRQAAVPPTQSSQDTEVEDSNVQAQPVAQQQVVALVMPRVEPPSSGSSEQGTSGAAGSNTVTTTQAGLKRPREVDTDSQGEDQNKSQQQTKRTRVQVATTEGFQGVSESGLVVEYQVPTSSQRDHEEEPDAVIVVESDEEGDVPDEGEGADDEPDDPDTEGYDMEGISYPEQEINYEDDCQEVNLSNEVEVIEDMMEVPNQSQRSAQEGPSEEESAEQAQSEAISSGTVDGTSGVTVSQASTSIAVTMPSLSRTRQIAPLSRNQQSHLLLPHGLDEGGDDSIVPSTPTLFVPRRLDGFGEAVSSPHVPTSGRFTFNEPGAQSNVASNEVVPEQTLEMSAIDDNSTGRSVPSTPLQASPQEYRSGSDEAQNVHPEDLPAVSVDEGEQAPEGSVDMGPPTAAGTSGEQSQSTEQHDDLMESEDGVSSEGEKAPSTEEGGEEEGREAEASPSTNTRSRSTRGSAGINRRSLRQVHSPRGMQRPGPTPIIWGGDQNRTPPNRQDMRGNNRGSNFSQRVARRSRGRTGRPYPRY